MSGVLLRFCGTVVAVPLAVWLLPGVHAVNAEIAWIAGVVLGLIFLIVRPIIKLLLSPLNCLTFGLVGVLVDAGLVELIVRWLPGFAVQSFLWALLAALLISVVREGLGQISGR